MQYQQNDIVQSGNDFIRVHAVIGDVVLNSGDWSDLEDARNSSSVYAWYPEDRKHWKLIERDGKPYQESKWVPKIWENYYVATPEYPPFYYSCTSNDSEFDKHVIAHGLAFPHTEEGKQAAIEKSKRMLAVE